ncbi:MAG: hypothetical protein JWN71_3974 [Xanthobacteraceae bacterium]|nr:hypothetical protein [Xanthobacteraceae bacterium]
MSNPLHKDLMPQTDRGGSADRRPDQDLPKKADSEQTKLDKKLDEALEESFPGSDPVSVAQPAKSKQEKHKD